MLCMVCCLKLRELMRFIILSFVTLSFAYAGQLPIGYENLGIRVNENNECYFTRNELNSIQLNWLFETDLKKEFDKTDDLEDEVYLDWNCFFFKRSSERDSFNKLNPIDKVFNAKEFKNGVYSIKGTIRYIGLVKKQYNYELIVKDGIATAKVKIYFKLSSELQKISTQKYLNYLDKLQDKMEKAQEIYNDRSLRHLRFKFEIVGDINDAHFTPVLTTRKSSGPYDSKWSTTWNEHDFAHEIGHMLGLDDEYDNIGFRTTAFAKSLFLSKEERVKIKEDHNMSLFRFVKSLRCDVTSLMCSERFGTIKKRHIYQIFNRVFN